MKKLLRRFRSLLILFGIDPGKALDTVRGLASYRRDLKTIKNQEKSSKSPMPFGRLYPCFGDKLLESGTTRGHYFHQDLLVARRVFESKPELHVDVGSRVDGFVAHVASFRPIKVLDIREMRSRVHNITYDYCDIMGDIPKSLHECCDSLSCLHAIEHLGLGRYGDPLNYDGHLVGFNNLCKILRKGGTFYFSVPIGPLRMEFNGCRAFSMKYLLQMIGDKFRIESFSFVDDNGDLFENVHLNEKDIEKDFGCDFGCGIFEMTKL
jgi:hypothetical protein